MELVDGHLDGQDVVAQTAVASAAVLGDDGGMLSADERPLLQLRHILSHRGHAHAHALSDLSIAEQTLIGLTVTVRQMGFPVSRGDPTSSATWM